MRRIVIAVMTTISGLALLFSYHTSTNSGSVSTALPPLGATGPAASDPATSPPSDPPTDPAPSDPPAASDNPDPGSPSAEPAQSSAPAANNPAATPKPKPKPAKPSGKFAGDTVDTRWGAVQVQITVKNGKVTFAEVLKVPWDNPRDQEINTQAVPILNQEVLDKQSPNIDGVSGATVTSDGYRTSLQSAFDRAHI